MTILDKMCEEGHTIMESSFNKFIEDNPTYHKKQQDWYIELYDSKSVDLYLLKKAIKYEFLAKSIERKNLLFKAITQFVFIRNINVEKEMEMRHEVLNELFIKMSYQEKIKIINYETTK